MGRKKKIPEKLIFKNKYFKVFITDTDFIIQYLQPHQIKISRSNKIGLDIEMVRMNQIKNQINQKYTYQKIIGKIFNRSRQMINRRVMVVKQKGWQGLLEPEHENGKLKPKVMKKILEMLCDNWGIKISTIVFNLIKEKLVKNISEASVRNAIAMLKGDMIYKEMKKRLLGKVQQDNINTNYFIHRLMSHLSNLIKYMGTTVKEEFINRYAHDVENIWELFARKKKRKGNKKKRIYDQYKARKKLLRDISRRFNYILVKIKGYIQRLCCPDCCSFNIKYIFQRLRCPRDLDGRIKMCSSKIFRCLNPECNTKYFTLPPKEVELYGHSTIKLKRKVIESIMHLRSSYRRAEDYYKDLNIPIHYTTFCNWIKKAGEEMIQLAPFQDKLYGEIITIDEKWCKIRSGWKYAFFAVDHLADDLLLTELYHDNGKESVKSFLLMLKSLGYNPKIIVTDLLTSYEKQIKEVFPDAYHHQCILHAERAARRLTFDYFPGPENKKIRKKIYKKLRKFFKITQGITEKKLLKRLEYTSQYFRKLSERTQPLIAALKRYLPKFIKSLNDKNIPKTSNAAERVIKEFSSKYQNILGYTSFHTAAFTLKLFHVYYRYKKYKSGRFKGFAPVDAKKINIAHISWDDILFGHFHF